MSLYNDVRPKILDRVFGNRSAVSSLKALFKDGPEFAPHAYLFHGPSGTGKTTFARIITSMIGSEQPDFMEINAAETRGIDTVRELINGAQLPPMHSKARVFLLDEAHQLTKQAQNALLKDTEESLATTYWIFCTTEIDGIIETLRNRCTVLSTNYLRPNEILVLLEEAVATVLEESFSKELLIRISEVSNGCARKALILLEKVMMEPDEKKAKTIIEEESIFDTSPEVIEICRAIVNREVDAWEKTASFLKGKKGDPEKIRLSLINYMGAVLFSSDKEEKRNRMAYIIEGLQGILRNVDGYAVLGMKLHGIMTTVIF